MLNTEQTIASSTPKKNPYTLWFVILSFVAPVVAAYAMFFLGNPTSFTNHGEILAHVVDIDELSLMNENREPMQRDEITDNWKLLVFANANCDDACNQTLYNMRQINIALGKHANRFSRMIIHFNTPNAEFAQLIEQQYPHARHAYAKRAVVLKAFAPVSSSIDQNEVYIMDPIGNIIMRYTAESPPKGMLKDMKKLLKASQIG